MPQPAAGPVPAFSFLLQQLALHGRYRSQGLAPAERRWGEEKRGKKYYFNFVTKSSNTSQGKWG